MMRHLATAVHTMVFIFTRHVLLWEKFMQFLFYQPPKTGFTLHSFEHLLNDYYYKTIAKHLYVIKTLSF